MNTMLATTDTMALTRMAVIGKRTNSVLMAGVKAMMVEKVKNQMRNGVAHFVYMKKSGEIREAFGLFRSISSNYETATNKTGQILRLVLFSSGRRTRTSGLRVMSPTSYQLLYPAMLDYKGSTIF